MSTELDPKNTSHGQTTSPIKLSVTDPPDFSEGGSIHRKSIIGSFAVIVLLNFAHEIRPEVIGIKVQEPVMWTALLIGHSYFFTMWRLTAHIENDVDKAFFNWSGIWKQATLGGTAGFPSKTKMQIMLIRALPIWAFALGLVIGVANLWYSI